MGIHRATSLAAAQRAFDGLTPESVEQDFTARRERRCVCCAEWWLQPIGERSNLCPECEAIDEESLR